MLRRVLFLVVISLNAFSMPEDICETGMMQSPINIDKTIDAPLPDLIFHYKLSKMQSYHNWPINYQALPDVNDELMLEIDTVRYPLQNIHLHHPAPHQYKGRVFPLEIHFVHTSLEGNQVIVAQWAQIGKHNPALEKLLNSFTLSAKNPKQPGTRWGLNPVDLLAPFRNYYQYEGSQINPPCTENATWYVLKDKIEVGAAQVQTLNRLVGQNTRPRSC